MDYVLAVYNGIVLDVYKPYEWLPAGVTWRTVKVKGEDIENIIEFVGDIVPQEEMAKYCGKSVVGGLANIQGCLDM